VSGPTQKSHAPAATRLPQNPLRSHAATFCAPTGQLERIGDKTARLEALGRIEPHKETK
jgi:hypothetical protein